MRTVITKYGIEKIQMFKEEEIRPKDIFDEYLALAAKDCDLYFLNSSRHKIYCPSCNANGVFAFEKNGFSYEQCPSCHTLYVSPRPGADAFASYYTTSASSKYWATTFYKKTEEARREKIWKPKAEQIKVLINRYKMADASLIDIGGGYGVFAEVLKQQHFPVTVLEPSPSLAAICREKGLAVIQKFLEDVQPHDLSQEKKVFVCFELFEHLHDPGRFLEVLYSLMRQGDLFIFSTLSGLGLDIQVLWESAKAVSPPHHLNFYNPHSIRILLEKMKFEVLEVTTPGVLDIDLLDRNAHQITDRFWKRFIEQASIQQKKTMQHYIAETGFSSHMRVVCKKS